MDIVKFADKYHLALQSAMESKPQGGLCGYELEWNLLDSKFRPLLTVGAGPSQHSFVDYLRNELLTPWLREYSQLEVFHWMIEWATRPYFHPRGAVYEARLMEALLINALSAASRLFNDRLYAWHGNLLYIPTIDHHSIPGSWHLAKRRYLERCVDLYGAALATAGNHTNLSLPEPLLAWDFMHLSSTERGNQHLDDYKSQVYITATRLMRAYCAMFIATSASTPIKADLRNGRPAFVLTDIDSVRNLTFPNPPTIDLPDLYRSYDDYLQISYDLVRRGIRFGNNNWTPVRARSFAEPVERIIAVTSDQLMDLYTRGLYAMDQAVSVEEMARQIEIQNLMARINLPMARVEVRTEDGGHSMAIDIANLVLKHLLLLRFYADVQFARAFRYDREDINRARRNEERASRQGLRAEIEDPLSGKPCQMREFLRHTLDEVGPLAEALGMWEDLEPLKAIAGGEPNTAERLRDRLRNELRGNDEVPLELMQELAAEREKQVREDVEYIASVLSSLDNEANKLMELLQRARNEARQDPTMPIRFHPRPEALVEIIYPDKTSEILDLAVQLIRIPSVTACPDERLDEVNRAATMVYDYALARGLGVRYYNRAKYPALLIGFPGQMHAPVMLCGHFDVVSPEPDDSQFSPRIEGDYLWGRGSADMKTVVASNLVWFKDVLRAGPPYPPVNLLLVGNEENGEAEPTGTPHVLRLLEEESGYAPEILIAGERTGERGNELWGEICTQNRGVVRFDVIARGRRQHSGLGQGRDNNGLIDLNTTLLQAQAEILRIAGDRLTLASPDGWQSQIRFPFFQVGTPGVYNITPDYGIFGVEIRPIPQDDMSGLVSAIKALCDRDGLEMQVSVMENGVACSSGNIYLERLVESVRACSGYEPTIGRKLPGTSARFAPRGQGVVWGQSGLEPHGKAERHYIPSIEPYYRALGQYGKMLLAGQVKVYDRE